MSHLNTLSLSFLICKVGIIIVSAPEGCRDIDTVYKASCWDPANSRHRMSADTLLQGKTKTFQGWALPGSISY